MYYKVVREILPSHHLMSAIKGSLMTRYNLTKPTFPKVGKLFVFDSIETAMDYANEYSPATGHFWVFECYPVNPIEAKLFTSALPLKDRDRKTLVNFWKDVFVNDTGLIRGLINRYSISTTPVPLGTMWCDSLILGKPVCIYYGYARANAEDYDLKRIGYKSA